MSVNECPVDGCDRGRAHRQAMCKKHWYMVPPELRREVFRTAREMWDDVPGGDQRWQEALDRAVHAVEAKEAG